MDWFKRSLKILNLRDHSEWEMRDKLSRKGATSDEIDEVIPKLYDFNYLNDKRFVEIYIRSRVNSSLDGASIIKQNLKFKRHIPEHLISSFFSTYLEESDYNVHDRIERIISSSDKNDDRLTDEKIKRRVWNKLINKGYSPSDFSDYF